VDSGTCEAVAAIAARHADVWSTQGVHPDSVDKERDLDWLEAAVRRDRVVGVGETGLDYFRLTSADTSPRERQRRAFAAQLELGIATSLPVVVHSRAAEADTLDLLRAHPGARGVLHCFTESWTLAHGALDLGWYVSVSGIVTFRNADNVRDVAKRIPADRLLVETDCPWLAPVPHRGHKNEPAYVVDTAEFLATLRSVGIEELAETTSRNFGTLFDRTRMGLR
jgi:TatD DNase family protein